MNAATRTSNPPRRHRAFARMAALALLALAAFLSWPAVEEANAAPSPGIVEVFDYNWMTGAPIQVDLRQVSGGKPTGDGDEFTVGQILRDAAGRSSGQLVVEKVEKIELALPGGTEYVTFSKKQIQNDGATQPKFILADGGTVSLKKPGQPTLYEYAVLNPKLTIPKSDKTMKVDLSPRDKTVESGTTISFRAKVRGVPEGASLTFKWLVGGVVKTTPTGVLKHTFKGDRGDSFAVALTVSASGADDATAGTQVFIGKSSKPKKKKENEGKKNNDTSDDPGDGYYDDPGYGDGYGTGLGDDYGNGSPGTGLPATPKQPKRKDKPEPPVDDGLETVRGELLDPSIPAQVIDPAAEDPSTSTDPGSSEEEKAGGFGLSGGAKTAIGIAFLLGLGGLTELRTFSRFR